MAPNDVSPSGHWIVLDGGIAHIQHKGTGREVRLHKEGSDFHRKVQIMVPSAGGRTNENDTMRTTAMLGEMGFIRQED